MARINVGSVDVSDRTAYWLRVASNINSEALRVRVSKALDGHVKRFKSSYAADVAFLARLNGVTWEQMFVLLNQHAPPFTQEELDWARQQPPLVIWEEEKTNFGVELPEKRLSEQQTELGEANEDNNS